MPGADILLPGSFHSRKHADLIIGKAGKAKEIFLTHVLHRRRMEIMHDPVAEETHRYGEIHAPLIVRQRHGAVPVNKDVGGNHIHVCKGKRPVLKRIGR